MAFTGSSDPNVARQYLEMSGNALEMAVSLFMDHGAGGGLAAGGGAGGVGGGAGAAMGGTEIRAPDASRTMRLIGGDSPAGDGVPSEALMAAIGGPAAREMMRNMMAAENDYIHSTYTTNSGNDRRGGGSRRARSGSGGGGGNDRRNNQRRSNNNDSDNDDDNDDDVQVVDADGNAMDEDNDDDDEYNYNDSSDDDDIDTMFAQPTHLMHRAGGFLGAKNFAKDARRWLLVNIQSDDDFACHALNRDVWRDELVENLVREGFILWQAMSNSNEGQTYITRYKVRGYPHLAIIDPRTGSLLWRKEGWTQVNPLTAEQFVEIASDFCSRHSFDKMPMAARHAYTNGVPLGAAASSSSNGNELTEEEQLQAAIRASMAEDAAAGAGDEEDNDEVQVVDGSSMGDDDDGKKPSSSAHGNEDATNNSSNDESKPSAFEQEILSMEVGAEPTSGTVARVQIRMPDGKRLVRKFGGDNPVKIIYAFVVQANEEAKGGRGFELKAKFPPQDLFSSIEDSISGCGLNGEAINVIWK
ncbi:hypothetical protein ACHAXR_010170 [Thalassiosira sp. AJA248-18]